MNTAKNLPAVNAEALAVIERYLVGINTRDTELIRDTFNFPHLRITATGSQSRYERREDYQFESFFRTVDGDGWHHSVWDKTEVVFATEAKAHVAVHFSRYRADDSLIGRYFTLYVVTRVDGHWGIQFGSGGPV